LLQCEKNHSAESLPFNQPLRGGKGKTPPENRYNDASFADQTRSFSTFYAMKLHASDTQKYQTVTGYDETGVEINAERYNYSLIVLPETPPRAWDVPTFESITAEHFDIIGADHPDVVILGTGARQRFIHPRLTAALTMRRIGVECMDSQAACRTYNILMGEGRKVTLALVIDAGEGKSA
jgi:uncharacterized protein